MGDDDADSKLPHNFHLRGYTAETMRTCNTLQLFTIVHKLIYRHAFYNKYWHFAIMHRSIA